MFKCLILVAVIGVSLAQEHLGGGIGGSNKYYVFGKANNHMAVEVCSTNGMRLVKVNDQNKNDEVTYHIGKLAAISGPFWTLASRLYDDVTWAFAIDEPVTYFNWAAGEPNNEGGNEKCVEIHRDGYWNDLDCSLERFVLCEPLTSS